MVSKVTEIVNEFATAITNIADWRIVVKGKFNPNLISAYPSVFIFAGSTIAIENKPPYRQTTIPVSVLFLHAQRNVDEDNDAADIIAESIVDAIDTAKGLRPLRSNLQLKAINKKIMPLENGRIDWDVVAIEVLYHVTYETKKMQ